MSGGCQVEKVLLPLTVGVLVSASVLGDASVVYIRHFEWNGRD